MIEALYQPQTSISNTYVLTFSDGMVKAIKKYVEQQSTPIFKEIIENVQADELPTEESDDLKEYQRYTELNEAALVIDDEELSSLLYSFR